ncbi:MAG: cytochrome c biogenesis protein CcsA [Deltaproteobacteria bacterium]|nr:cytochrome c biogenesis protein CcsA [Deltaproteobacteria bacterium]
MDRWLPWLAAAAGAAVVAAVGLAWLYAPVEAVMGLSQKIFYFHVPSAWAMYAATGLCGIASTVYLVTNAERADALAAAAGSVALLFSVVVLVTGPIWARAAWSVWWRWEPRLTTVLVLALLLAAYAVLRRAAARTPRLARFAAALAILAVIDLPIIHLAVRKWRGNHPTVLGSGGGGLSTEMAVTLGVGLVAFTTLALVLLRLRYRLELARRELDRLVVAAANAPPPETRGGESCPPKP